MGQSAAQFVNAITVDLPSPNDESNRRCGGLRSFSMLAIQNRVMDKAGAPDERGATPPRAPDPRFCCSGSAPVSGNGDVTGQISRGFCEERMNAISVNVTQSCFSQQIPRASSSWQLKPTKGSAISAPMTFVDAF